MKTIFVALILSLFMVSGALAKCPYPEPVGCPNTTLNMDGNVVAGDLSFTGTITCADLDCSGGLLLNDATAEGSGDYVHDDADGDVLFHVDVDAGSPGGTGVIVATQEGIHIPVPDTATRIEDFDFVDADISGAVITEVGHNLASGNMVTVATDGGIPSPLSASTQYFVLKLTNDTFSLATTAGGTAIELTGTDGGATHSIEETIPADQCGGMKKIDAIADVTTSTRNTFPRPSDGNYNGCIMHVKNISAYTITLDGNPRFNDSVDYVLLSTESVIVGSDNATSNTWRVIGDAFPLGLNQKLYSETCADQADATACFTFPQVTTTGMITCAFYGTDTGSCEWVIDENGAVIIQRDSDTADCDDANTDAKLNVIDGGSTLAILNNRLGQSEQILCEIIHD
jgi:hypothetical protein